MSLDLISSKEFKKMREENKNANKEMKIKETILNAISKEIKGEKTRTVIKRNGATKTVKNRSNIVVMNGETYYNLKFGSHSFGSVRLNEKDMLGALESLKKEIFKGALDSAISEYANSKAYTDQQERFNKSK